jgi:hypothetical protein
MTENINKDDYNEEEDMIKVLPRFGKVAIELGFITIEQLKEGLTEQIDDEMSNKPHRQIGMILNQMGYLTRDQIFDVLDRLEWYKK